MTGQGTRNRVEEAIEVIAAFGLPRSQQNRRSALCLLALLNVGPRRSWAAAEAPLLGVTPIMEWVRKNYHEAYAPNTRETFRRQSLHQFVSAGIILLNPDDPSRAVNSPKTVYQVEPAALELLRSFGTEDWKHRLSSYLEQHATRAASRAKARERHQVRIAVSPEHLHLLSPGEHSELIRDVIEKFLPRFVPGAQVLYIGDTGDKWGYVNRAAIETLALNLDAHGKMPDVVLHDPSRGWLVLVEAVTSHGPVDAKRHEELSRLFAEQRARLVFVTAFPNRALMGRYLASIAWETEVWVADSPGHLIHFNGERFLGPYSA